MSTMTNAGVTIMSSISAIAAQAENPLLAEVLTDVGKELESGKTFSEACAKHKDFFPNIFISMVEAGEASGALDDVLGRMAEYFENQSEIREKVKSATTYPTFIGVAAVAVVIVLMTTVIPGFASMFAEGGQDLPGITVAMMAASNFMQKYFYIIVPALIVAAIAFKQWSATTKGRHTLQRLSIRLPKFGTIFRNSAIGRFCRSLSILVASGVPMIQALEIVARVVNNVEYSSAILHARKGVSEGMTLSQGLSNSPHFTPLVLHMLKVGEEAGALDDMLAKVADFYEAEVKYTVDRLSSIIEPIMILG
jgi:type IV pilus assembly protein PilC